MSERDVNHINIVEHPFNLCIRTSQLIESGQPGVSLLSTGLAWQPMDKDNKKLI